MCGITNQKGNMMWAVFGLVNLAISIAYFWTLYSFSGYKNELNTRSDAKDLLESTTKNRYSKLDQSHLYI